MEQITASTLDGALRNGDLISARRALRDLVDEVGGDLAIEHLARWSADGSEPAVELLVELLDRLGLARRAVRGFLADEAAVEDVTQETLISVRASAGSFEGKAKFTTWLHQIARNRAVDYLRRHRPTVPIDDRHLPSALRMSSLITSREAVRQMLDLLPDLYREPVVLRDVERLPYIEVAARLGRNVNTIKSQVARGRAMLAEILDEDSLR